MFRAQVRRVTLAAILSGAFGSGIVAAHHSVAPYDRASMRELEGVISGINWRNPHIRLTLSVTDGAGRKTQWELEGDSANAAARKGFTRDSVRIGDRVKVAGWPSTRGRQELFVINILAPSGVETVLTDLNFPLRWTRETAARRAVAADAKLGRSIFRVWAPGALYVAREPIAYTAAAQAARATWDPLTDMPALKCIPPGMPNATLNPYPIQFIDEGKRIRMRIEEWEATRTIDMVAKQIPAGAPAGRLGYSIGRWEGDTLVIETARIDFPYLDDEGTPMSAQAHVVERFTVNQDGSRLDYTVSVTDPPNLVKPAVWDAHWSWVPGTVIRPFECELK
jgi:hypothetical protein